VMEKCTYCVQRIRRVGEEAHLAGRDIADGDVVTACAQACPTDAIVFGRVDDPTSRVSTLVRDRRAYSALGDLGVRPRTRYLAKVRR
jgi:Fe-S-cluster-containing dehydrogenase component